MYLLKQLIVCFLFSSFVSVYMAHKCAEDDIECHEKAKYSKGTHLLFGFEIIKL
jgi:hypothetical protein